MNPLGGGSLALTQGEEGAKRRLLLVASTGGHLWQLDRLAPRLGASADSLWITFDTAQSRAILAGRPTVFVPYVSPRDWRGALRATRLIRQVARAGHFDGVVSTGAGIAVSAMVATLGTVADRLYIESVSRFEGPSLSGSIIARAGLARTLSQHRSWSSTRWVYEGSVLQNYVRIPVVPAPNVERVFITLGTIKPYRFNRLLRRVVEILPAGIDATWQVGESDGEGLPGRVHRLMTPRQFEAAVHEADVVVTHAGIGTLLGLLEAGRLPVAVPRESRYQEHVDDHQRQAAAALAELGLAVSASAELLSWSDLVAAAAARVQVRHS